MNRYSEVATDRLIEQALRLSALEHGGNANQTQDDDDRWAIVQELQGRGSRETFEIVKSLLASPAPQQRRLGADVLGQLGYNQQESILDRRPYHEETLHLLTDLLAHEIDSQVLESAIHALGHTYDHRALACVLAYACHSDPEVRFAVAAALPSLGKISSGSEEEPDKEDERAVESLIRLTNDLDDDVRDWATFGLGTLVKADSLEIREALARRINDSFEDVRQEAICGLALRRDERGLMALLDELRSGDVAYCFVDTAGDIGDPRFYQALLSMRAWWEVDPETLENAFEACRPKDEL